MNRPTRLFLALGSAGSLLAVVGFAFWQQDLKYSRPTPRPASLRVVVPGSQPDLRGVPRFADGKPIFLHFFNPGCPCSRFNLDHVRALAMQQKEQAHFVAVLQGDDEGSLRREFASLGLDVPSVADTGGAIAAACGVYSTPQAVILGGDGRLFFRGNYNVSRYCPAQGTEFARIALEALLAGKPAPVFPDAALVAYGCELPANLKNE